MRFHIPFFAFKFCKYSFFKAKLILYFAMLKMKVKTR